MAQPTTIVMGYGIWFPCEMHGKGSICLKNDDRLFRMLNDVKYVPTLTKNLISMGCLGANGFEVKLKTEVMKIISVASGTQKGTRKSNNLYYD